MLLLVPSSVWNCWVLRKILLVSLTGWQAAVARRGLSCHSPGCGAEVTGQTSSLRAAGPNQAAAFDPASNGVLQLQGQLVGQGGGNFLVWQLLLWVLVILHHGLEIWRAGTTRQKKKEERAQWHIIKVWWCLFVWLQRMINLPHSISYRVNYNRVI